MSTDAFTQRIIAAHQRVDALMRRANEAPQAPQGFLREAMAELRAAEEDLQAAETGLGLQSVELAAAREELVAERRRYRELFEFADCYVRTDPQGKIGEANRAALELLRAHDGGEVGSALLGFFIPEDRRTVAEKLAGLSPGEAVLELEVCLQPREGPLRWVALTIEGIPDLTGRIAGLRWLMRDITRRRQLEIELQRTNTLLTSLSHTAARMESTRDPDWVMQTLGAELSELDLACLVALLDPESETLVIRYFWAKAGVLAPVEALAGGKLAGMTIPRSRFNAYAEVLERGRPVLTQDGASLFAAVLPLTSQAASLMSDCSVLYLPLRVAEQVIGAMGIQGEDLRESDISTFTIFAGEIASTLERSRLFLELERQHAQLQALSSRLVTVLEDERRRIARELHDEAGQLLYGLRLHLDVLARQIPSDLSQIHTQFSALSELLDAARARIHKLSQELRPPTLDDLGLEPVLQRLVGDFGSETGLAASFTSSGVVDRLAPDLETACYRIVQEALTNVVVHAEARQVEVGLAAENGYVWLRIADDGRGFDPRRVKSSGLGLLGIEERAIALGGSLVIHSAPGGGTRLEVTLPRHLED